jgi:hypothetical protein
MRRTPALSALTAAVALWVVFAVAPLSAIGPSLLMFYGGGLAQPIVVSPGNPSITPTGYLWNPATGGASYGSWRGATIPANLEGRAIVNMAIFWGRIDDRSALKPSDASQHGRIYVPTETDPPVVVVTAPLMREPGPVPVPTTLGQFLAGWKLTPEQTAELKRLAALF